MKKILIFILLSFSFVVHAQMTKSGVISSQKGIATFSPITLSPIAWWDSDASTMSATGDYWNDKIGLYGSIPNFYNMGASGGSKPTYNSSSLNGRPSFSFNGSSQYFSGSEITQWSSATNFTVWMVGKRSSFTQNDGTSSNLIEVLHLSSDENVYAAFGGGSFNYGLVLSTNAYHYYLFVYDGSASGNANRMKVYIDGVLKTLSFSGTIPSSVTAVGAQPNMGFNGSAFFLGENCEIGFVNRTITSTEITKINTYLSAKYGL